MMHTGSYFSLEQKILRVGLISEEIKRTLQRIDVGNIIMGH